MWCVVACFVVCVLVCVVACVVACFVSYVVAGGVELWCFRAQVQIVAGDYGLLIGLSSSAVRVRLAADE